MSQENVERVRRGYEHFAATGDFVGESTADFVWDMSKFRGWPEQQTYEGVEGARVFLRDWIAAWDDWELEVEALHDAGDKVVVILRQRGQSKTSGLPVDMAFGQVSRLGLRKARALQLVNVKVGAEQHQRPQEDREQRRANFSNRVGIAEVVMVCGDERPDDHVDDRDKASPKHARHHIR